MRYATVLIVSLVLLIGCATRDELDTTNVRIMHLEQKVSNVEDRLNAIENQNDKLLEEIRDVNRKINLVNSKVQSNIPLISNQDSSIRNISNNALQCKAITKKGTRCARQAQEGSEYCWQHQTGKSASSVTNSTSSSGNEIMTGPRGGQYYINKNGKKTYIKRK